VNSILGKPYYTLVILVIILEAIAVMMHAAVGVIGVVVVMDDLTVVGRLRFLLGYVFFYVCQLGTVNLI